MKKTIPNKIKVSDYFGDILPEKAKKELNKISKEEQKSKQESEIKELTGKLTGERVSFKSVRFVLESKLGLRNTIVKGF